MQTLTKSEQKIFEQICRAPQATLKETLCACLQKKYKKVVNTQKYLYAVGDIPVALVAHMDTVFPKQPSDIYYDTVKNVMWSPQGLGADDRAGVFGILQIIKGNLRPHVIFTTDEETGAHGAYALAALKQCPFPDLRYLIQLDRRGTCDCVFYDCDNKDFEKYVESFGFITNYGSFSDISVLAPAWKVAAVNLSIGYQSEHSVSETFFVQPFLATIEKVRKMLAETDIPSFKYVPLDYSKKGWGHYGSLYSYGYSELKCECCGRYFLEEEMFPVYVSKQAYDMYCPDCIVKEVNWCYTCGRAFKPEKKTDCQCQVCAKGDK